MKMSTRRIMERERRTKKDKYVQKRRGKWGVVFVVLFLSLY